MLNHLKTYFKLLMCLFLLTVNSCNETPSKDICVNIILLKMCLDDSFLSIKQNLIREKIELYYEDSHEYNNNFSMYYFTLDDNAIVELLFNENQKLVQIKISSDNNYIEKIIKQNEKNIFKRETNYLILKR